MKTASVLKFLAALVVPCVALSCSKDSDDDPGTGGVDTSRYPANAVYTDYEGDNVVASKIGDASLFYNSDGFCTRIADAVTFFYDRGLMLLYNQECVNFSIDARGYITGLDITTSYVSEFNVACDGATSLRMVYDASGYIVRMTMEGGQNFKSIELGTEWREDLSGEMTFRWDNGRLLGVESEMRGDMCGSEFCYKSDFTVKGSGLPNALRQYTVSYADFFDRILGLPALAGFYGKAPAEFIGSVVETYDDRCDGTTEKGTNQTDYRYEFFPSGTVSAEFVGCGDDVERKFGYLYETLADEMPEPEGIVGGLNTRRPAGRNGFGPYSFTMRHLD